MERGLVVSSATHERCEIHVARATPSRHYNWMAVNAVMASCRRSTASATSPKLFLTSALYSEL